MARWTWMLAAASWLLLAATALPDIIPRTYGADYIKGTWGEPLSLADYRMAPRRSLMTSVDFFVHHFDEPSKLDRQTAFLTLDFGISSSSEVGIRMLVVGLSKGKDDSRTGFGDLLLRFRSTVHRSSTGRGLVSFGIGFKLPTAREGRDYVTWYNDSAYSHRWRDLATGTGTYDFTTNLYAEGEAGIVRLYGYLGTAIALKSRHERDELGPGTLLFEGAVGLAIHPRAQLTTGLNGYIRGDALKVTFVPRLQTDLNDAGTAQAELGFDFDLNSWEGLEGFGAHVGLRASIGL